MNTPAVPAPAAFGIPLASSSRPAQARGALRAPKTITSFAVPLVLLIRRLQGKEVIKCVVSRASWR